MPAGVLPAVRVDLLLSRTRRFWNVHVCPWTRHLHHMFWIMHEFKCYLQVDISYRIAVVTNVTVALYHSHLGRFSDQRWGEDRVAGRDLVSRAKIE